MSFLSSTFVHALAPNTFFTETLTVPQANAHVVTLLTRVRRREQPHLYASLVVLLSLTRQLLDAKINLSSQQGDLLPKCSRKSYIDN